MRTAALVACALAACASWRGGARVASDEGPFDAAIVLYRDGAVVEEEHEVAVGGGTSTVRVPAPAGSGAGLEVTAATAGAAVRGWAAERDELAVQIAAGRAGRTKLRVRYVTARLQWQASYTLLDDGARGRVHGALALDNATGRRWQRARIAWIDRNLPAATPTAAAFEQEPVVLPGRYLVVQGGQRIDLGLGLGGGAALRPTLVYDPVGTRLDSATMTPQFDRNYGIEAWPAAVDESVRIDLARVSPRPLPPGPVRVFSVGAGGALVWRGEGRLLAQVGEGERYTTVAVGRSPDVTGRRRRTDYHLDLERGRLVEEHTIELHNAGAAAAEVLVREHMYRGACWTLVYASTGSRVAKEPGSHHAVSFGVTVPAGGDAIVMYRVAYRWDELECRERSSKSRT